MSNVIQSDIPASFFGQVLEAKRKGGADDLYILDIRDAWERKEYEVPFALAIPAKEARTIPKMSASEFKKLYGVEKPKKDSYILLVCEGGRRAMTVKQFLREKGFKHVFALVDGLERWVAAKKGAYDEDL